MQGRFSKSSSNRGDELIDYKNIYIMAKRASSSANALRWNVDPAAEQAIAPVSRIVRDADRSFMARAKSTTAVSMAGSRS
jgi:hypothetical protein